MILSETIPVKIGAHPDYYRAKGYEMPMKEASPLVKKRDHKDYVIDKQKQIDVKIEDLPLTCKLPVFVECDMCHNTLWTNYSIYNIGISKGGFYACKKCSPKKQRLRMQSKYGVEYSSQLPGNHDKIRTAWDNKTQEDIDAITEKRRKTFQEKYGVDGPMEIPEFVEKQKATTLNKYGYENAIQSPEIQKKMKQTMYSNETTACSKQQKEIFDIFSASYDCKLNYPIDIYSGDIVFPNEHIDFEYDGSGHDLCVYRGLITRKEFERKEIIRNLTVKKEGYNTIRLISRRDKLPSKATLLNILDISKDYFQLTGHSWIDFDVDNNLMRSAVKRDGVFYNFGELHKVSY